MTEGPGFMSEIVSTIPRYLTLMVSSAIVTTALQPPQMEHMSEIVAATVSIST